MFHRQLPTPVVVFNLRILLDGCAPQLVDILLCRFSFGFRVHFQGAEQPFEAHNLRSASENPTAVDAKLQRELGAGRLAGPFTSPPFKNFRVSPPLGLVPKKQPGEFCIIHLFQRVHQSMMAYRMLKCLSIMPQSMM